MKEYKVLEAKNSKEAEKIINDHAKEGFKVISVVFWSNFLPLLIITLEKDKDVF
jgi:hypothetical protein